MNDILERAHRKVHDFIVHRRDVRGHDSVDMSRAKRSNSGYKSSSQVGREWRGAVIELNDQTFSEVAASRKRRKPGGDRS